MSLTVAPTRIRDIECVMVQCTKCGFVFLTYIKDFVHLVKLPHHVDAKKPKEACTCTHYKKIKNPSDEQVDFFFPKSQHLM
jgi:hypothetical protein